MRRASSREAFSMENVQSTGQASIPGTPDGGIEEPVVGGWGFACSHSGGVVRGLGALPRMVPGCSLPPPESTAYCEVCIKGTLAASEGNTA